MFHHHHGHHSVSTCVWLLVVNICLKRNQSKHFNKTLQVYSECNVITYAAYTCYDWLLRIRNKPTGIFFFFLTSGYSSFWNLYKLPGWEIPWLHSVLFSGKAFQEQILMAFVSYLCMSLLLPPAPFSSLAPSEVSIGKQTFFGGWKHSQPTVYL